MKNVIETFFGVSLVELRKNQVYDAEKKNPWVNDKSNKNVRKFLQRSLKKKENNSIPYRFFVCTSCYRFPRNIFAVFFCVFCLRNMNPSLVILDSVFWRTKLYIRHSDFGSSQALQQKDDSKYSTIANKYMQCHICLMTINCLLIKTRLKI